MRNIADYNCRAVCEREKNNCDAVVVLYCSTVQSNRRTRKLGLREEALFFPQQPYGVVLSRPIYQIPQLTTSSLLCTHPKPPNPENPFFRYKPPKPRRHPLWLPKSPLDLREGEKPKKKKTLRLFIRSFLCRKRGNKKLAFFLLLLLLFLALAPSSIH